MYGGLRVRYTLWAEGGGGGVGLDCSVVIHRVLMRPSACAQAEDGEHECPICLAPVEAGEVVSQLSCKLLLLRLAL